MSSEESQAQGLVPKLRFPEFRGAGEWELKPLSLFAKILTDRVGSQSITPYSITSGIGLVSQEEKFGRTIAGGQLKNYIALQHEDFAYNKSATKEYPQGFAVMFQNDAPGCVPSSIFTCFRIEDENVSAPYLDFLLRGNLHGRWLASFSAVGARANGSLSIDDRDFLALPVPLPKGQTTKAEQQKIVECLSSLDDVIAAQGERLAALKDYKKGLMQALFPAPGQTAPRLRFPEFRDKGGWKMAAVGDVFTVTRGNVLAMTLVNEVATNEAPFPVYSSQTKRDGLAGYYSEFLYEDAITWTTDGANAGEVKYRRGKFYCTNVCGVLINREGFANDFVAELLNSVSRNYVSYVGNPKLMNGVMASIQVPLPTLAEQSRIADCLTSVNTSLAQLEVKIEALKYHKRGLMQQLFPATAEASA